MERRGPSVLIGVLPLFDVSAAQADVVRTKRQVGAATIPGPALFSVAPAKSRAASFPSPAQKTEILANYSRLPLSFNPNQGQTGSLVQCMARGSQFYPLLTQDEVVVGFARRNSPRRSVLDMEESAPVEPPELSGLELPLVSASPLPVSGAEELRGKANYLVGCAPGQGHANLLTCTKVCYGNVPPGIELLCSGNQQPMAPLKRPREFGRVQ